MAVLTLIIVTDKTFLSLWAFALIFAHEAGHIISAKILNVPINEINFGAASIDIPKSPVYYRKSFVGKMIIILSGFIFNLLIFIILSGIYIITENKFVILIALQSLVIGVINILPIESLDGGEAVNLVLRRFLSYENSKIISGILSIVFLMMIAFLGIFLMIKSSHSISIVFLAIYLIAEKYFM